MKTYTHPPKTAAIRFFAQFLLFTLIFPLLTACATYKIVDGNLTINDGVKYIDVNEFENKQLISVTIPNSVTSIGNYAFAHNQITNIIIPNGVTSIGDYAFAYNQLTNIKIPDGVTLIGDYAFIKNKLTNVTIGKSVNMIGASAFSGNDMLNSITFQGTINFRGIGTDSFPGDLKEKYLAGGIGTYTTTAPVNNNSKWSKK